MAHTRCARRDRQLPPRLGPEPRLPAQPLPHALAPLLHARAPIPALRQAVAEADPHFALSAREQEAEAQAAIARHLAFAQRNRHR